jgi:hypothetical protein
VEVLVHLGHLQRHLAAWALVATVDPFSQTGLSGDYSTEHMSTRSDEGVFDEVHAHRALELPDDTLDRHF